jgi:quercetin dioxygenase-like cupin family protein
MIHVCRFKFTSRATRTIVKDDSSVRPTGRGSDEWFTGTVWLDEVALGVPPSGLRVHSVTFEPGARVQSEGGSIHEIRPGDTVWIALGVLHWHGAAPDRIFAHLAIHLP